MPKREVNGQRPEDRELEEGRWIDRAERLKNHSMTEQGDTARAKRKQKIEGKQERLCTQLDSRISSESLLFLSLLCGDYVSSYTCNILLLKT